MTGTADIHSGSCLCGAVTYQIAGDFDAFFLCHCHYCQKDTGSAHASNLAAGGAKLTWLTGRDQVKSFNLPGTRHVKSFCSECGSAVPSVQESVGLLIVPAGGLDSSIRKTPDAHIMMGSKADWESGLDKVPMLGGMPGFKG